VTTGSITQCDPQGSSGTGTRSSDVSHLDLLGTPTLIGLAHVGWRLDGGDELEDEVGNTGDTDDGSSDLTQDVAVEDNAADEDVD